MYMGSLFSGRGVHKGVLGAVVIPQRLVGFFALRFEVLFVITGPDIST